MANLKEIRIRITSVKSTKQITAAMKMVAAAKLRRAQDKIVQLRPYAGKLKEILSNLSGSLSESDIENVYARAGEPDKVLLVVITSNRGLCGAFNANIIKETRRIVAERYMDHLAAKKLCFLPIGKKGAEFIKKQKYEVWDNQSKLFDDLSFENVSPVATAVMDAFVAGSFDRVEIIYNQFRNPAVQDLTCEQFLPVEEVEREENAFPADYIYEPTREEIVNELIPKSLRIQFYKVVLDSFVAEHGARMTAMHAATDNATELIRELTLQYNKARQAAITNQIMEVVSGAEALR